MIDTSFEADLRTLGKLSFAFGIPGSVFVLKYLYDRYFEAGSLPAVYYMLPIGAVLLAASLLLAPAAYKSMLPGINLWIQQGEDIISRAPRAAGIKRVAFYVSLTKCLRLMFLCSHPIFAVILVEATRV